MIDIPLQALPNQSFSVNLDGNVFDISLNAVNGAMCASVSINNAVVISGIRLVPGTPILPYLYLENGNLLLLTNNADLPDYTQFGITQYLVYASAQELEAIRAAAN